MPEKQLCQGLQNRLVVQPPLGPDRQALPGVLVDHRQHPEGPAVFGTVHDEVIGPDMVPIRRPEPDAGAVIQPEPDPFGLFVEYLEPLPAPGSLHALVVHVPALVPEKGRYPPVAVAAVLSGQVEDRPCQGGLVVTLDQCPALGRSGLTDDLAGPPLRNRQCGCDMAYSTSAPFRAQ